MQKLLITALACTLTTASFAKEIKHRFLATDESGDQILYVDQVTPNNSWKISAKGKPRDLQLIGKNRVLISHLKGYYEIDIKTGEILKDVNNFGGIMTARRTPDGKTYLGNNVNGITIHVLNKNDKEEKVINIENHSGLRLMRFTSKGTILMGANKKTIEIDMSGNILKETDVTGAKHIYKVIKPSKTTTLLSAGYGGFIATLDKDGNITNKVGQKAKEAGKTLGFFADFQLLQNGNIIVTNWHGHKRDDSKKGDQILEFDKKGDLVWSWHDPELAGCIHGIIVLDKIKTQYLHTEKYGKMLPLKKKRKQ